MHPGGVGGSLIAFHSVLVTSVPFRHSQDWKTPRWGSLLTAPSPVEARHSGGCTCWDLEAPPPHPTWLPHAFLTHIFHTQPRPTQPAGHTLTPRSWVALGAAGQVGRPGGGGAPWGGETTAPSCVQRAEAEHAPAHLSWWMTRLMASKSTAFLALECCTFLDLGGSWALLRIASRHSVRRPRTAGSSGQNRQPLAGSPRLALPQPGKVTLASHLMTEGEDPDSNPEAA